MLQKALLRLFLVLTLMFSTGGLFSQVCDYSLAGLIEDTSGEILIGATVLIKGLNTGTVSDENGSFTLENLCAGSYTLVVTYLGYEEQFVTVRLPSSKKHIITLKPTSRVLHDIVVEGEHSRQHSLSQSLYILSEQELVLTRGKSLGEVLQQAPGVTNLMSGPGVFKPVINGLHSQRILILNNGVRQEGQQWGLDHAPEIDSYVASDLEVVKGAETVRYGAEAMGGVIIVNPAPLHYSSGIGGEAHIAVESNSRMGTASAMLEGGIGKNSGFGWRIQGTLKKGGDHHAPSYNLSNTGKTEKDFSAAAGYRKKGLEAELFFSSFNTAIGILRSSHSGNLADLQNSITREKPWYIRKFSYEINNPRQEVGHHLLKFRLKKDLYETGILNLTYSGQLNQRREFDIRRDKMNIPALSLQLFNHTLDASLDLYGPRWSGSYGIGGVIRENDNETGIGLLPDYSQYSGGVFAFQKYKTGKWLLELGGRYDHQWVEARMFVDGRIIRPTFSFDLASVSFGGAVLLNDRARVSTNLGVSTRAPLVNELFSQGLHHGSASIEEGLLLNNGVIITDVSDFSNERSLKWISTFQYHNKRVLFDLNAFVNAFSDFIFLAPYDTRLTIRGYFPVFQYRQVDALLVGGDVSIDLTLSDRWSYNSKASVVRVENLEQKGNIPSVPPADFENAITYSTGKLGKISTVKISLVARTTLKQTRAPRTVYPADVAAEEPEETFDFMPPPDGYSLFGLDLSAFLPAGNKEFIFSISGENLANTRYRNYMNRMRYFADDTGRNFTLRISYKFHSHQNKN